MLRAVPNLQDHPAGAANELDLQPATTALERCGNPHLSPDTGVLSALATPTELLSRHANQPPAFACPDPACHSRADCLSVFAVHGRCPGLPITSNLSILPRTDGTCAWCILGKTGLYHSMASARPINVSPASVLAPAALLERER